MRPDVFVSRVVHTIGGALLFASCAAPFIFDKPGER
jgi:hypothetical protein